MRDYLFLRGAVRRSFTENRECSGGFPRDTSRFEDPRGGKNRLQSLTCSSALHLAGGEVELREAGIHFATLGEKNVDSGSKQPGSCVEVPARSQDTTLKTVHKSPAIG